MGLAGAGWPVRRWIHALVVAAVLPGWAGSGFAEAPSLVLKNGGVKFPDGTIQHTARANFAPVERTGQTSCYDADGVTRDCAGTGEDGEHQAGVPWPSPRLIDNGDGTITDRLTGLMWLQDFDCALGVAGDAGIDHALAWVESLDAGSQSCAAYTAGTYTDWRLPNLKEILSLVDYTAVNPALPGGHPFVNVAHTGEYPGPMLTSSSTAVDGQTAKYAWGVSIDKGVSHVLERVRPLEQVIAVRGAATGPAPPEVTGLGYSQCYALDSNPRPCAGTGEDGELQFGVPAPTPRFIDHQDGTVTDEMTGLTWLKDADCPGNLTWQGALDWVASFNTTSIACAGYTPLTHTDWRLPNIKELLSLIDYGIENLDSPAPATRPLLPDGHPFVNVARGYVYWSSTSSAEDPSKAWYLLPESSLHVDSILKTVSIRVWPVRGGQ